MKYENTRDGRLEDALASLVEFLKDDRAGSAELDGLIENAEMVLKEKRDETDTCIKDPEGFARTMFVLQRLGELERKADGKKRAERNAEDAEMELKGGKRV